MVAASADGHRVAAREPAPMTADPFTRRGTGRAPRPGVDFPYVTDPVELLTTDDDGRPVEGTLYPGDLGSAVQYPLVPELPSYVEELPRESALEIRVAYRHTAWLGSQPPFPEVVGAVDFYVPESMLGEDRMPGRYALRIAERRACALLGLYAVDGPLGRCYFKRPAAAYDFAREAFAYAARPDRRAAPLRVIWPDDVVLIAP